jgi:hypothetical protein
MDAMDMLDVRISELTSDKDDHLLRSTQPYGWPGLWRLALRSRLGWSVWAALLAVVVLVVAAIWMGAIAIAAAEVLPAVKYGIAAATCAIVAVQLQVGLTPHLQTERVLRALKRLEILLLSRTG